MAHIYATATVRFDYDTEDGFVASEAEAAEDVEAYLRSANPSDFVIETGTEPDVKSDGIFLVYEAENGEHFTQSIFDLNEAGTLIDPETGDDLTIIGWTQ